MKSRFIILALFCAAVLGLSQAAVFGQKTGGQTELSTAQRLDVMSSKLDLMRRSLNSAIGAMPAQEKDKKPNADDPLVRLKGLEKEVSSLNSEVNDIKSKNDKAEKFDPADIDRLEQSVAELSTRVDAGLQQTASARTGTAAAANSATKGKKKKGKLFGLLGGGEDKYADLTGAAVAGRDRVLFEEAAKEVRKGHHDTGRLLFATIIN